MLNLEFRNLRNLAAVALMAAGGLYASAQSNKGTISPVESDDEAPPQPTLHYYDKHGNKLDKPVLYLAELDTVSAVRPKSPYPLFCGVPVGVNFADAIMSAIGQSHQSYDISAMVSLHNWFFPVVEAGMGWGHYTDNNDLYKVKAKPSMYAKAGINYNFLYKSDPAYMGYLGVRFGVAQCKWDKTDIRQTSEEGEVTYLPDEMNRSCTSVYGELLAGLKVKIAGPFSLGWNVRYRLGLHSSGGAAPWFVPGYGTGPLGFTFNAYWTFGQKGKKENPISQELSDMPED
ncbi:MAG: hypothetical protein K2L00_04205 [Muribaculaceae bacterium]|nr:hypothetical protein [Muribaculaceae bacterium]